MEGEGEEETAYAGLLFEEESQFYRAPQRSADKIIEYKVPSTEEVLPIRVVGHHVLWVWVSCPGGTAVITWTCVVTAANTWGRLTMCGMDQNGCQIISTRMGACLRTSAF